MGREIRRVPPDWEHPRDSRGRLQPLFNRPFEQEARGWLDAAIAWDNGTDKDCAKHTRRRTRSIGSGPATHYQMYENVTEGTPVTPHFATMAEIVDYLVQHGEDGENRPWDRAIAERFVKAGYAPSMVISGEEILVPRTGGF